MNDKFVKLGSLWISPDYLVADDRVKRAADSIELPLRTDSQNRVVNTTSQGAHALMQALSQPSFVAEYGYAGFRCTLPTVREMYLGDPASGAPSIIRYAKLQYEAGERVLLETLQRDVGKERALNEILNDVLFLRADQTLVCRFPMVTKKGGLWIFEGDQVEKYKLLSGSYPGGAMGNISIGAIYPDELAYFDEDCLNSENGFPLRSKPKGVGEFGFLTGVMGSVGVDYAPTGRRFTKDLSLLIFTDPYSIVDKKAGIRECRVKA